MTTVIINWSVPLILSAILGAFIKIYKDSLAIKEAMISLLRSQIVGKIEEWTRLGYMPDSVRQCLDDLFKQYKQLGGNHGVDKLVDKAYELPLRKEDAK